MTDKERLDLIKEMVKYRAKHNLSMLKFAQIAGIGVQTVFNIENSKTMPTRIVAQKIRNIIGE